MSTGPVRVTVPASKSETHRALLLGALSSSPCRVRRPLLGADCRSTLTCLQAMGARAEIEQGDVVFSPVESLQAPAAALDCGNSGTTLRLLTAQAARLGAPVTLTGDASLRGRPNGPLLTALMALGAEVESARGAAPLTICGPLSAGDVALPPRVSSQYATGLLLALALTPGDSTLRLPAPVSSRPYLEITRRVAAAFGLVWDEREGPHGIDFAVPGGQRPAARDVAVAGDWSGAAFPLVAGALTGRAVRLIGLERDSPQGDRALVGILQRFGLGLSWEGTELVQRPARLRSPGRIDLDATPDLFPALCVLAALTPGETELSGAPSLRHKECDRIAAMAEGLTRMGIRCRELPDGLVVTGGHPSAGSIESHHDHRIYMAFRALSLRADGPVSVSASGCEAVSYPAFEADLARFV